MRSQGRQNIQTRTHTLTVCILSTIYTVKLKAWRRRFEFHRKKKKKTGREKPIHQSSPSDLFSIQLAGRPVELIRTPTKRATFWMRAKMKKKKKCRRILFFLKKRRDRIEVRTWVIIWCTQNVWREREREKCRAVTWGFFLLSIGGRKKKKINTEEPLKVLRMKNKRPCVPFFVLFSRQHRAAMSLKWSRQHLHLRKCVCVPRKTNASIVHHRSIQTTTTKNGYQKEVNLNKDNQGLSWENNNDRTLNLSKNQMFCQSICLCRFTSPLPSFSLCVCLSHCSVYPMMIT